MRYILGIDQSTQGTKGLLFDEQGELIERYDLPHEQIINHKGWVEHDPNEIIKNTILVVKGVVEKVGIVKQDILGVGISNQRETAMVWDRKTGEPVFNAIVWQCARGEKICNEIETKGYGEMIKKHTGLHLSPYFSAAKISWILKNSNELKGKSERNELCCGTMDSWLIYKLTKGKEFKTDYSNASRTQLFNIQTLSWDQEICALFGINPSCLAEVCDSNAYFGETDLEGYFDKSIPIHGVLGDSHGALYGQGCLAKGMIKSTYGTGSSVMMNIGNKPIFSKNGVVTSLAWGIDGQVNYVLEGNINYTGAVISWLQNDLKIIKSAEETEKLAELANLEDRTYLVPAFTGLGAPYWDSKATGIFTGMTRVTGQAEMIRAALDCIAYQIADIVKVMGNETGIPIQEVRADGGPTRNRYLMQFQSDMLGITVQVSKTEELSGIGAAYAAGIALNLYDKEKVFSQIRRTKYEKKMEDDKQLELYQGWRKAVQLALTH